MAGEAGVSLMIIYVLGIIGWALAWYLLRNGRRHYEDARFHEKHYDRLVREHHQMDAYYHDRAWDTQVEDGTLEWLVGLEDERVLEAFQEAGIEVAA